MKGKLYMTKPETQKTKVVIAAPNFSSSFQTSICEQLRKWFKPEEMTLRSVKDNAEEQKKHLEQILRQGDLTALIAISVRPDPDTVASYTAANVPIVLIDEETKGVSTIFTDNCLGGRLAGEHLIAKGKKRIAIVSGRTQVEGGYNAAQRFKGFQEALNAAKLSVLPECTIEVTHYSREDGLEVMPKLLDKDLDAIFCAAGDNCALGLLTVTKERGMQIPEDIAIMGFDDLLAARVSSPPLTTIKQPLEKMAEAAYNMAVVHRDEILKKPQKAVFEPELVVRQSA